MARPVWSSWPWTMPEPLQLKVKPLPPVTVWLMAPSAETQVVGSVFTLVTVGDGLTVMVKVVGRPVQPFAEGVIERARRLGEDIGQALTDPNNPIVKAFAKKMKVTSFIAGGRRLDIDSQGGITAGPHTKQEPQGEL